jgi:hypothetical protein
MSKVLLPVLASVRPVGTSTRSPLTWISTKSRRSTLGKRYRKSVVATLLGLAALPLTQLFLLGLSQCPSMANPIKRTEAEKRRKCFVISRTHSILNSVALNHYLPSLHQTVSLERASCHASDHACSYILSTVRLFVRSLLLRTVRFAWHCCNPPR